VTRTLPSTPALRALREAHVAFEVHPYRYEERGGTRVSARELGVDEHAIVKTLVLRDDVGQPMLMLMHGDREVSLKARRGCPARHRVSVRRHVTVRDAACPAGVSRAVGLRSAAVVHQWRCARVVGEPGAG
jgi:prolyl-tRNA editing enzyme YbaK/EbsC (Cys-tRNA(Pro) deacylase)